MNYTLIAWTFIITGCFLIHPSIGCIIVGISILIADQEDKRKGGKP